MGKRSIRGAAEPAQIRPLLSALLFMAGLAALAGCSDDWDSAYADDVREPTSQSPHDLVDPFIATGRDHGQQHPAAMVPFGMVKLGPDTYPGALTNEAHSGYDYWDRRILGFSHIRFSAMGAGGLGGNILVIPRTGRVRLEPRRYAEPYEKVSEAAAPGYYGVRLANGIMAEMTATTRVGVHRYTLPAGKEAHVLLDLSQSMTRVNEARLEMDGPGSFSGWVRTRHRFNPDAEYTLYFAGRFDRPPDRHSLWRAGEPHQGVAEIQGRKCGGLFWFSPPHDGAVQLAVAVSTIDGEAARSTLESDLGGRGFDEIRREAADLWSEKLALVQLEGGSTADRRLFYTSLYRSFSEPMVAGAPDGRYRSHDMEVRRAKDWTFHDGWTTWDTFRTKFPLLTLLAPQVMDDITRSLEDNLVHVSRGTYPFLMVRFDMTAPILLDAWRKGVRGFDLAVVHERLAHNARHQAAPQWEELGYYPGRPDLTLEHAYFDWCVAEMAAILGHEDEAGFRRRAAFHRNTWNPESGFFQARDAGGGWMAMEDPDGYYPGVYYEGTPWHWRWFVPHDPDGLIGLFGGRDAFIRELRHYFDNNLHNMGNQVALKVPWLFSEAGRPDLTRATMRRLLTEEIPHRYENHRHYDRPVTRRAFRATPDGFIPGMDDDAGTMSAWFVWSALGIYPITPGKPHYALGYPLFPAATITLPDGGAFRIERPFETISQVFLNGEPFESAFITHEEILAGGVLRFDGP